MSAAVTEVHLTLDDLSTICGSQTSLIAGPISLVLPHDPADALNVVSELQKLLRGATEHLLALQLHASEELERAAGRAVNVLREERNAQPFGSLPRVVPIPVQGCPAETPESAA
jgi:hypothetical protein